MDKVDKKILKIIHRIIIKLNENNIRLRKVYLFGSFANGTANEWSDLDIALVSPDFSNDRFEERIRIMQILNEIDNRIEPVPYRPENFQDIDPLVWEIKQNGITIPLHE